MLLEDKLREGCIIKVFYDKETNEFVTRVTDDNEVEGRSIDLFNSVSTLVKTYELEKFLSSQIESK